MAWLAWITLSGSRRALTACSRAQRVGAVASSDGSTVLLGEVEVVARRRSTAPARPSCAPRSRVMNAPMSASSAMPHGEQHELARRRRRRRRGRASRRAQRAAELAQLDDRQRRARARAGELQQRLDRLGRAASSISAVSLDVRHRLLGVLVQAHERGRGDRRERVDLRARARAAARSRPGRPGRRRRSSRSSGRGSAPGSPAAAAAA